MRIPPSFSALIAIGLLAPLSAALAEPPAHAPAHGYRAKKAKSPKSNRSEPAPRKGIEVVFDSEKGIYVGVGLPDVLFHEGRYYREREGRWEISLSGSGDWKLSAAAKVPSLIIEAKKRGKRHPGPAHKK